MLGARTLDDIPPRGVAVDRAGAGDRLCARVRHELRGISVRRYGGAAGRSTRTISIAAYQQAFELYDMSYASAVAVIMGLCQLAALIIIILVRRRMTIATTMGVGKR